MVGQVVIPGTSMPSWSNSKSATDLGIISQEGERVSTVLMIDERRFCLTIEPAPVDMLPDLQLEIADMQSSSSLIHQTEVDSR